MLKTAQWRNWRNTPPDGGITADEMRRIYELTYKYQMLRQEEERGDYGTPSQLADQAYIEIEKITDELENALNDGFEVMEEAYRWWVDAHEPAPDAFGDTVQDDLDYLFSDLDNVVDLLGEDHVLEKMVDYIRDHYDLEDLDGEEDEEEEAEAPDPYEEKIQYLDKFSHRAQQQRMKYMDDPEMQWTEKPQEPEPEATPKIDLDALDFDELREYLSESDEEALLKDMQYNLDGSIYEELEEKARESYYEETALGSVQEMQEELSNWHRYDLDNKITLFQKALNVAHNNGSMAEYILTGVPHPNEFLEELSNSDVTPWNRDLQKMLGYEPGSRSAPKSDWFVPARLRGFRPRASLTKEQLTSLYELMYKYGWLVAEERELMGELPDRAYTAKARIEGDLRREIADGLAGIIESYDTWLYNHKNWAKVLRENRYDDIDTLYVANIFDAFEQYDFDYDDFILNLILPYVPGVQEKKLKNTEYRDAQLEVLRKKYTSRNHRRLINDFADVIVENMGVVLQWGYKEWRKKFPDLEKVIPKLERVLEEMEQVVNSTDLSKLIQMFHVGLTTGHVTGSMADHILNMPQGAGKAYLDQLSAGPKDEWDRELGKILSHPPGQDVMPKKTSFLKTLRRVARLLRNEVPSMRKQGYDYEAYEWLADRIADIRSVLMRIGDEMSRQDIKDILQSADEAIENREGEYAKRLVDEAEGILFAQDLSPRTFDERSIYMSGSPVRRRTSMTFAPDELNQERTAFLRMLTNASPGTIVETTELSFVREGLEDEWSVVNTVNSEEVMKSSTSDVFDMCLDLNTSEPGRPAAPYPSLDYGAREKAGLEVTVHLGMR